jgi:hypothetical protein
LIICMVICVPILSAETIFIYLEESCNNQHGIYLDQVKEGIFDALFEAGHVVFDDVKDNGGSSLIEEKDFKKPITIALKGGAKYVLAVRVRSETQKISENSERISGTAQVYLLLARTGVVVYTGEVRLSNNGNEVELTKDKLGFELGGMIAALVTPLWAGCPD